ncbi:hypothetical protein ACTXT7_016567, partial [Hymenolepis weldensis]
MTKLAWQPPDESDREIVGSEIIYTYGIGALRRNASASCGLQVIIQEGGRSIDVRIAA